MFDRMFRFLMVSLSICAWPTWPTWPTWPPPQTVDGLLPIRIGGGLNGWSFPTKQQLWWRYADNTKWLHAMPDIHAGCLAVVSKCWWEFPYITYILYITYTIYTVHTVHTVPSSVKSTWINMDQHHSPCHPTEAMPESSWRYWQDFHQCGRKTPVMIWSWLYSVCRRGRRFMVLGELTYVQYSGFTYAQYSGSECWHSYLDCSIWSMI